MSHDISYLRAVFNYAIRMSEWRHDSPFVLEAACNEPLWWKGFLYTRADEIAAALPEDE